MKNQYVADTGDYGKYGLLRYLIGKGVRVGVNWYLTPDDGTNDGKKRISEKDWKYDPDLFEALRKIFDNPEKSVEKIERSGLLRDATFYHEIVDKTNRTSWHENALNALSDAELIFCDPDNGPIGTKKLSSKDSDKYITPEEIVDYYNAGHDVVYYCQKARRTEGAWLATKREMEKYLPEAKLHVLTYRRGTRRSYIFVIHPERYKRLVNILYQFISSRWGCGANAPFIQENTSVTISKDEEAGNAMKIILESGDTCTIKICDDGWVEIKSTLKPNCSIRRRADQFVRDIL